MTSQKILRTRTGPLRTRVGPGLQSGPKSVRSGPVLGPFVVLGLDLQTLAISTSQHPIRSAPTDIAMKRNGKRDRDATLSLQTFKVGDALT